jgi:NAD(P)-dependent dehydrogenase (short-subunit alcohol dehydrogenase family)
MQRRVVAFRVIRNVIGSVLVSLDSKVAIVTGGAHGIGRAIVRRFLEDGARVVLADIDDEAGATTESEFADYGEIRFIECDVSERLDVRNMIAETVDAYGGIDILVNNAGIVVGADFLDLDPEDFERVIKVNLTGYFLTGQAVARQMVDRVKAGGPAGTIINVSSVNAVLAIANQIPYTVSKGGINQLTKVMALALAPHGIRVNGIGPGSVMTELLESVMDNPEVRARILSRTPLGRIGEPHEVAGIAAFLASDDASYVTGQTIYADGGRLPLNYTVPVAE